MQLAKTLISTAVASAIAIATLPQADAHSWIDCLDTNRHKIYDQSQHYIFGGSKGNGYCDGYAAGYPGRGAGDIGTTYTYKMLKNTVDAGTDVCQHVDANTYSGWRKRLSVDAGAPIYFSYLPNGHVVKDKMGRGTKHGIYWTGKPGSKLTSTKEMTQEHLVDGKLMDFDDGNCGETVDYNHVPSGRAGDGKPCIGSFTIPKGSAPGVYHFVWFWTFYRDDNNYVDPNIAKGYFGAAYSSCFEVEVTGSGGGGGDAYQPTSAPEPTPEPAPEPAPTQAPTQAPEPAPTQAPTHAPEPAPTQAPTPAPEPTKAPETAAPQLTVTEAPAPSSKPGNGGVNPPDYDIPDAKPVTPAPTNPKQTDDHPNGGGKKDEYCV